MAPLGLLRNLCATECFKGRARLSGRVIAGPLQTVSSLQKNSQRQKQDSCKVVKCGSRTMASSTTNLCRTCISTAICIGTRSLDLAIESLSLEQIKNAMSRDIDPGKMIVVQVGDFSKVAEL